MSIVLPVDSKQSAPAVSSGADLKLIASLPPSPGLVGQVRLHTVGKFHLKGLEAVGQAVVVGYYYQHINDTGIAHDGTHGLEGGVGDAVVSQQFQDELDNGGVIPIQAGWGAKLADGGDHLVAEIGFLCATLIDGPDVVAAGFTGGGQDGDGFYPRVQGSLKANVAAQAGEGAGSLGVVEQGGVVALHSTPRLVWMSSQTA